MLLTKAKQITHFILLPSPKDTYYMMCHHAKKAHSPCGWGFHENFSGLIIMLADELCLMSLKSKKHVYQYMPNDP